MRTPTTVLAFLTLLTLTQSATIPLQIRAGTDTAAGILDAVAGGLGKGTIAGGILEDVAGGLKAGGAGKGGAAAGGAGGATGAGKAAKGAKGGKRN